MPIDYQTTGAYLTQVRPLVERGLAVPLFSWGILDAGGNFVRDPNFPDLPHFADSSKLPPAAHRQARRGRRCE